MIASGKRPQGAHLVHSLAQPRNHNQGTRCCRNASICDTLRIYAEMGQLPQLHRVITIRHISTAQFRSLISSEGYLGHRLRALDPGC